MIVDVVKEKLAGAARHGGIGIEKENAVMIRDTVATRIESHAALCVGQAKIQPLAYEFEAQFRIRHHVHEVHDAFREGSRNPLAMHVQSIGVAGRVHLIHGGARHAMTRP